MSKNEHKVIRYTLELDTITSNNFRVELTDDMIKAVCQAVSSASNQTNLKLVDREEVK